MKRAMQNLLTLTAMMVFGMTAYAANDAQTAAAPSPPDAKAILHKMAQQLAQAPGFSVTIRSDYDAMQANNLNIEFGNKYQVQLQRPAQLRIDTTRSDGDEDALLFDGKTLTAYKAHDNIYARVEKPGTVDNAVVYLVQDLQITIPLARILLTTLPQVLESKTESVNYVEKDVLLDVPTDHIVARTADIDLQLWVTQSEPFLPRKIIITYKREQDRPQFRAELFNWNLAPAFKSELFSWTPPKGAEHVPFLAPVHRQGSVQQEVAP